MPFFAGHRRTTGAGPSGLILASAPGVSSHAGLRGASPDYGSWSKWAYSSLGSRSLCLGHSVLPLPCENRRLSMGFYRDIFCSSSMSIPTVYMSLSTGVYFTSTTADQNDWESSSFSPASTEFSLQPHHSATASLPTAECTAVSHPAMQPHLLGTIALHCARVNSNGHGYFFLPCRQHALVHLL